MYDYLAGRLRQMGINQSDLARRYDLTQASISKRFTGKVAWNVTEMYDLLDLCKAAPEEMHIYFPRMGCE